MPNFSIQGVPITPELLSNKLILTPPAPGNYRGAVWSEKRLEHTDWIADVEFRATGPERGGGNLQIWLARDGAGQVGSSSIYTVGRFEGLALVVDTHGGYGSGMIRGFLNDGQTEYKATNVDQLSFGHCAFAYRNLGRPSQVKLRHSASGLRVEVDGTLCFESDQVRLPTGYQLGITAASADNPDSFEVFKLVVLTEDKNTHANYQNQNQDQNPHESRNPHDGSSQQAVGGGSGDGSSKPRIVPDTPLGNGIPDENADKITSSKAQFADLHNRLQEVSHQLSGLYGVISQHGQVGEKRHEETSVFLGEMKGRLTLLEKLDRFEQLEQKINNLERELQRSRNDLGKNIRDAENAVKAFVSERQNHMQENMRENIKTHVTPGHTKLIVVIIVSQLVLAGAFIVYKRRKSTPKKYL